MTEINLDKLASASRRSAVMTAIGLIIVLSSMVYAYLSLGRLQEDIDTKRIEIKNIENAALELQQRVASLENAIEEKQKTIDALDSELKKRQEVIDSLAEKIKSLSKTQGALLEFLSMITDKEKINIVDRDVDWDVVKKDILNIKSEARKQAILTAILISWKDIPFTLGQQSLSKGFDSPRLIEFVLSRNGVKIDKKPNERMSDAIMRNFKRVEKPEPGDLVFYKGQVGSFGFIYVSEGGLDAGGVGIGTLQAMSPLQIVNLNNVNTQDFPLIGYFRVVYPGEN